MFQALGQCRRAKKASEKWNPTLPYRGFSRFFSIRCRQQRTSSKVIEVDKREIGMKKYASIKKNQRWELRPSLIEYDLRVNVNVI